MRKQKSGKQKRFLTALAVGVCLASMTLPASAASSTDWTANTSQTSLFKKVSTSKFEILGGGSQPVTALSYDPLTTNSKSDISAPEFHSILQFLRL